MRLLEVTSKDGKTCLKFRALGPSTSTEDGGDKVTDYFVEHIAQVFGKSYADVCEHLSIENGESGDIVLIEGLLNSIELEMVNPKGRKH